MTVSRDFHDVDFSWLSWSTDVPMVEVVIVIVAAVDPQACGQPQMGSPTKFTGRREQMISPALRQQEEFLNV